MGNLIIYLHHSISCQSKKVSNVNILKINSKKDRIMKKNFLNDDQEVKYILRQIGFGAVLGIAFLATVFIGGLLAHLVSGM